nr:SDR family NAD(P)-dependent oxidoreductase [Phytohabitans suffuscus]
MLGDPIEAQALVSVFGGGRGVPLWVGSLKSNIGHASAAAGIGGVIKTVEALRHATLPPTLHVDEPTPLVDWAAGNVRLLTQEMPWPETGRPRRAGVSAFGASGTNAHVVLEQAPEDEVRPGKRPEPSGSVAWLLSGGTPAGLRRRIERLRDAAADRPAGDVARALLSRAQLRHRCCVTGRSTDELRAALDSVLAGGSGPAAVTGVAGSRLRPVFVFPGQGWQWAGMGMDLLAEQPVFATAVGEVDALVRELAGWSPLRILRGAEEAGRVDRVQPTMFAVLVGLARMWESVGVRPAAVVGHSQGEIAAAYVAGVLSLRDAVRITVSRSRALVEIAGHGAMASVMTGADQVAALLTAFPDVVVAAVNGPASTVVSGPADSVAAFLAVCMEKGVRARPVDVDYASHSPAVEAVRDPILADLGEIIPHTARVPLYSTTTGALLVGPEMDAGYWFENLRRPVRFADVIGSLLDQRMFLEISAHPVLVPAIEQIGEEADATLRVQGTLLRDAAGSAGWLSAVGRAWVAGATVNWPGVLGSPAGAHELPVYDFDRTRFWAPGGGRAGGAGVPGMADLDHGLLTAAVRVAGDDGDLVLSGRLSPSGWLTDHRVASAVVVPGTAFVEMALRAGQQAGAERVEELVVLEPLTVAEPVQVQVVVGGDQQFAIYSRPGDNAAFTRHAAGRLRAASTVAPPAGWAAAWPPAAPPVELDGFYDGLAGLGYGYGPVFRGVRAAWQAADGTVYGEVELPETVADLSRFGIHPALLDSAAHLLAAGGLLPREGLWLPFSWQDVELYAAGARRARVRVTPVGEATVRIELADDAGRPLARIDALRARRSRLSGAATDNLHQVDWHELDGEGEPVGAVAVIGDLDVFGATRCASWADVPPGTARVLLAMSGRRADPDEDPAAAIAAAHEVAERGLSLFQELAAMENVPWGVTVVTHAGDLAATTLHGLVRTVGNELPNPVSLLVVDGGPVHWPAALGHTARQPHLAWHAGRLLAPRVAPAAPDIGNLQGLATTDDAWHLAPAGTGSLDDIAPVPAPAHPLPPGHVRIRQRAAGLNFHDVVVALGMVPGDDGFGGEGAGTVTEVGAGVTGLRPGDRVFGVMASAFAPVTVADARTVARMPDGWTWEQGASVPAAYITAYFALVDLAQVRPGQRVLIHAATGGVGTAAVQLARHLGAEVYATASPGKWPALHAMGIPPERIAPSRTLAYAEAFAGQDIDVTLGALAGEHVDATLSLLGEGGCYLEMGKTDIRDAETVAARHPGVRYRAFDAAETGPERTQEILTQLLALFHKQVLAHPRITAWPLPQARQALRHLARGEHIGKCVLTIGAPLDPRGTILITGGTGTLGGMAAKHLAAPGRKLLLLSRQGPAAPGAEELRAELTRLGADVTITACDTADAERLAAAIGDRRLTAVIHTAGLLRDATLANQSAETLHEVLRAKIDTAVHLHHLTRDHDLAAFVLYSSAAGLLGNPGQANYTAASTYLDALAAHRQARGMAATSIAWGLWSSASAMTMGRTRADQARMAASPLAPLTAEQGLRMLDAATGGARHLYVAAPRSPGHVPVDPLWGRRPAASSARRWRPYMPGRAPSRSSSRYAR